MQKLAPAVIEGWVRSMRQCAGLPGEPRQLPSGTPHVLFVNRAVGSGRSVLSMSQVRASRPSCPCASNASRLRV